MGESCQWPLLEESAVSNCAASPSGDSDHITLTLQAPRGRRSISGGEKVLANNSYLADYHESSLGLITAQDLDKNLASSESYHHWPLVINGKFFSIV